MGRVVTRLRRVVTRLRTLVTRLGKVVTRLGRVVTRMRKVVSFGTHPLYCGERFPLYPLNRRMGGSKTILQACR